jgi:hypothetical protein
VSRVVGNHRIPSINSRRLHNGGRPGLVAVVVVERGEQWQDWAMANLIYSAITSLDGFTADGNGDFDWAAPDELAAHALAAGLVDECHLFLNPVVVGGGTRALPAGLRLDLELLDEHRFGNGVVYLRYRVG